MPKDSPATTQDASKTLQAGPRMPPEAKNDPKCLEKGSTKTKNTPKDGPQNAPRHLKLRLEGRGGAPRSAGSIRRPPGSPKDAGGVSGVPDPALAF